MDIEKFSIAVCPMMSTDTLDTIVTEYAGEIALEGWKYEEGLNRITLWPELLSTDDEFMYLIDEFIIYANNAIPTPTEYMLYSIIFDVTQE